MTSTFRRVFWVGFLCGLLTGALVAVIWLPASSDAARPRHGYCRMAHHCPKPSPLPAPLPTPEPCPNLCSPTDLTTSWPTLGPVVTEQTFPSPFDIPTDEPTP